MNSTHRVDVVQITEIEKHPNADALGIVRVMGYQCCVRLSDWKPGDLAAYIQPDTLVNVNRSEFAHLKKTPNDLFHRVRVIRLRGQLSQGLLVRAPDGAKVGDDVAEILETQKYQPPETDGGDDLPAPSGYAPVYDLESAMRYADSAFRLGELVHITEKIHGENARFTFRDDRMHYGSRTRWKVQDSAWASALQHHPEIREWCERNPGSIVYGELYGRVGGYPYDVPTGQRRIAVFDLWHPGSIGNQTGFIGATEARERWPELPWVPLLDVRPYAGLGDLLPLAEGPTVLGRGRHLREGIVIKPSGADRYDPEVGRVALKIVGNGFLEREK